MSFKQQFKDALTKMVEKDHHDCKELKFSDKLYVHVESHEDGKGAFSIDVIVPHEEVSVDIGSDTDYSQLPPEIPGVDELYNSVDEVILEVTGEEKNFTFQLSTVVDDGTWDRDATVFSSFKLTSK